MNSFGGDCFMFEFRWPGRGPLQQFPHKVPSNILLCATIFANDLIPRSLDGAGSMGSPSRVGLHDGDILRGWIAQQYTRALQSPSGSLLTPQGPAQQQLGQDTSTCPQVNTVINGTAPQEQLRRCIIKGRCCLLTPRPTNKARKRNLALVKV